MPVTNVILSAAKNLLLIFGVALPLLAHAASAEKGKTAFLQHGCWQCHGFEGQGGTAGKQLAPKVMPLAAMSAFVRNSNGPMPPYTKAVLTEDELADIHAYLESRPKPRDYKSIPQLAQ
jgi:ubiquinol-cytochrome c reductase cytochrome c subunit